MRAVRFRDESLPTAGSAFGARPLRRWLEQHVITDLSHLLVAGQLADNSDVTCDVAPGAAAATLPPPSQSPARSTASSEGILVGAGDATAAAPTPTKEGGAGKEDGEAVAAERAAEKAFVGGSSTHSGFVYRVAAKPGVSEDVGMEGLLLDEDLLGPASKRARGLQGAGSLDMDED